MATKLVYLVTNTVSGKRYVGVTSRSLATRWKEHRERAAKGQTQFALHRAIQKYGSSSFKIELVAELDDRDDMLEAERIFIGTFGTYGSRGYNMTPGGESSPTLVKSIAARGGRTRSERYRGASHWHHGRTASDETKEKMSAAHRARAALPEAKAKRSAAARLAWQNPEVRAKRIAALKGKPKPPRSEEHRQKLSACKKGLRLSNQHKSKVSCSIQKWWDERRQGAE